MRRIFAAWRRRVSNSLRARLPSAGGAGAGGPGKGSATVSAARMVLAGLEDPAATARAATRRGRALGVAVQARLHDGPAALAGQSLELHLQGPAPALRQALAALIPLDGGTGGGGESGGGAARAVAIGPAPLMDPPASSAAPPAPAPPATSIAAQTPPAAPALQTSALPAPLSMASAQYHALTRALSDTLYAPIRARAPLGRDSPERAALVALAEAILPPHLHDNIQRDMGGFPGHAGLSFATEIRAQGQLRRALQRRCGHAQEFLLEDKAHGRAFARALGLRLPRLYQQGVPAAAVVLRPDTVIKPVHAGNGRGVFLVDAAGRIDQLRPAARGLDEPALRAAMAQHVARGVADRWLVEARLHAPDGGPGAGPETAPPRLPTDIKVYSFYGRTPLALEVDRTGPAPRHAWHRHPRHTPRTEAGPPPIGKYEASGFDSRTDPAPFFRLAARISQEVPAPFLRIDFLNTECGPVFGEFTPRPGQFHSFDPRTDRWLGWECATARARLLADLAPQALALPEAAPKEFARFRALVEEVQARKRDQAESQARHQQGDQPPGRKGTQP